MTTIELINFSITVFLGGASIALAIFAFVSSIRNNKDSRDALDKLKELSSDIKANLYCSLENQKGYTDKMLDTIISGTAFGDSTEKTSNSIIDEKTNEELLDLKVNQIEKKLNSILENKINEGVSKEVQETLSQLRKSFRDVENIDDNTSNENLPFELKEQLIKWKQYPAFFLILGVIIKYDIKSINEFKEKVDKFLIPLGWEDGGLPKLEQAGFIIIEDKQIQIPSSIKDPLNKWTEKNWQNMLQLRANYKSKDSEEHSVTDKERIIGSKFKI